MTQAGHPQAAQGGWVQPPLLISSSYSEGQGGPSDASDTLCSQKKTKTKQTNKKKQRKKIPDKLSDRQTGLAQLVQPGWVCWVQEFSVCSFECPHPGVAGGGYLHTGPLRSLADGLPWQTQGSSCLCPEQEVVIQHALTWVTGCFVLWLEDLERSQKFVGDVVTHTHTHTPCIRACMRFSYFGLFPDPPWLHKDLSERWPSLQWVRS